MPQSYEQLQLQKICQVEASGQVTKTKVVAMMLLLMLLSLLGEKLKHFVETKRISIHLDGLLEKTEFELGDHL